MSKPNVKLVNLPHEIKSKGRFHQVTLNAATATTFAAAGVSIDRQSDYVLVSTEGGNWRWRDDGTAPTTSVGHPEYNGDQTVWHRSLLEAMKIIEVSDPVTLFLSELGV